MVKEGFTLPSFAKINLGLRVGDKRPDGYHDIETVFQTISLADELTFEAGETLVLASDDPSMPTDGNNIIVKAAALLSERAGLKAGASIFLKKRIPSPGGLGGGSSNAAVTLLALNYLWEMNFSIAELASIGSGLGADVPFFLTGGTAKGSGRGDMIESIAEEFSSPGMVIVTPDVAISTSQAYRLIAEYNLTKIKADNNLNVCRFGAGALVPSAATLINDFENPIFALYPEISDVKHWLLDNGASAAVMSGSGASVAGFFDNEETRQTAMKALGQKVNWRSFAVVAISRKEYREALHQVF